MWCTTLWVGYSPVIKIHWWSVKGIPILWFISYLHYVCLSFNIWVQDHNIIFLPRNRLRIPFKLYINPGCSSLHARDEWTKDSFAIEGCHLFSLYTLFIGVMSYHLHNNLCKCLDSRDDAKMLDVRCAWWNGQEGQRLFFFYRSYRMHGLNTNLPELMYLTRNRVFVPRQTKTIKLQTMKPKQSAERR